MSYDITGGTTLVVGMVYDGFWGYGGFTGGVGGSLGIQHGSALSFYGPLCPSGSLVRHQICLQTLHSGVTGQCVLCRYH